MYRLGLDIGTTSVGWAVLNMDSDGNPNRIIDFGVRIFDAAENPKDGSSLAAPRRRYRSARRLNRRHKHRLDRIKALLHTSNVISKEELKKLYSSGNNLTDIYQIRYEALERKLSRDEFARLLVHLSQRRGFKSNRKNEDKSTEAGQLLSATSENVHYMKEKGYLTVGEMLYKDERFQNTKHNKGSSYANTFLRNQIEEEVNIIFSRQKDFGSSFVSEEFVEKYKTILFSQREFDEGPGKQSPYAGNQIEKMVGKCTFEKDEPRAPKASYTFEYFNLLQKVNNIRIQGYGIKRELTPDEKSRIVSLCLKTEKVDYARIRKELELEQPMFLFSNLSYGNKEIAEVEKTKFQYMSAYHEMRKAFDKLNKGYIANISVPQRNLIALALTYYKNDEKILDAIKDGDFTPQEKEIILGMNGFSKVGHLSVKAMQKIIPYLEKGLTYDKACEEAGYNFKGHSGNDKNKYLPVLPEDVYEITSPVVKRSINQTIKVINAIIKKYGSPSVINIELAREMSKNFADRKKIEKEQKENEESNLRLYQEIKETFKVLNPSGQDILKYRLWQEQQGVCLYTSTPIKAELLFSPDICEIDHIIPYSISFDDRYTNKALVLAHANREKGNRVPLEYVESKIDFIAWVNTFINNKTKKQNLLKENITDEDRKTLKNRSLQDTQFITSFLANYIRDNLLFDENYSNKQKVISVNGRVTAYLRKRWGINKYRNEGDVHHAIDAIVVGCISQGTVQKVTEYSQHKENCYIAKNERYYKEKFPFPWPEFKKELDIRVCKNPVRLLEDVFLANYIDVDLKTIKPIFVSKMKRVKSNGQAHEDTIRSLREVETMGISGKKAVVKTSLQKLKLNKDKEIDSYYNPQDDRLLYELLKEKLIDAEGDAKKAFPEGFVFKPTPKGGEPSKVKSVKTYKKTSLNVSLNDGKAIADNGDMVRIDLYKVEGDGYYFVPIYVADLVKDILPNKAPSSGKNGWKIMKDEDFLFSIYPKDLLRVEYKNDIKFSKVFADSNLPKEFLTNNEFVYYNGADIDSSRISVVLHDNSYKARISVKSLLNIEKYHVDVLGNKYKASMETRK